MAVYLNGVALMSFLVDFLLLIGTNCLCGYPPSWLRSGAGALVGGVYGAACMSRGFFFLGNFLWRMVFLGIIGWVAFGYGKSAVRRIVIFMLLCMALGGVAQGLSTRGISSLILSAVVIFGMCVVGFRDIPGAH